MKTMVIGYGNTLRGDDGFGCYAAERLMERANLPQTEFLILQQLTPEIAIDLSSVDLVVFIDVNVYTSAGEITIQNVQTQEITPASLSHHLTPQSLLALAQALYGTSPQGTLFSAGAESFDLSEHLSPALEAIMPEILERIETFLKSQE
ncbi:MAG: hydrogenase maturation protease [Chloroflexota bacterium]